MIEILVAPATYTDVIVTGIISLLTGTFIGYISCSIKRLKYIRLLEKRLEEKNA